MIITGSDYFTVYCLWKYLSRDIIDLDSISIYDNNDGHIKYHLFQIFQEFI